MAPKGRLDYGFNAHDAPNIPRAPRSIRGKGLGNRVDGQVCAFELLATVAGKLLQESECSSASSSAAVGLGHCTIGKGVITEEVLNVHKPFKEHDELGSSEESIFFSSFCSKNCDKEETNNLVPEIVGEAILEHRATMISCSTNSGKADSDVESAVHKGECQLVKLPSTLDDGSAKSGESYYANLDNNDNCHSENNITTVVSGAKEVDGFCRKSPALGSSSEIVDPMAQNSHPEAPFLQLKNDVNIGNTDDDEIFSRSSRPSAKMTALLSPTRCGDQRIRKLLASKYWKVAPKLKDSEVVNTGSKVKHVHRIRKYCYEHDRAQCDTRFKKRKLFDQNSTVAYDQGNSSECVSKSPEDISINKGKLAAKLHAGHQKSPSSTSSNVKFSIKSFKVPELHIEVPEDVTLGLLKKTILNSLTTMLGDGLRVGVLLHGKKVRDDNRTLLQTGISRDGSLDALGFLLEPSSPIQPSSSVFPETPIRLICDSPRDSLHRSQITRKEELPISNTLDKPSVANSGSYGDSSQDFSSCPAPYLENEADLDSKALMPVPETTVKPLAMVHVSQRSRRSEIGQRRTRRPFSVTEVEALVAAVEKLGTGRWRDIKLSAFENAKHRTYVDLKDKWKTLVHTARISPQQRRGEPVPQELLDRVLVAHACWTQNQAKQQHGILKITEVWSHC